MPRKLEKLLTAQELADLLGVPINTIYVWNHRKLGPRPIRIGRYVRYRPEDVEKHIAERQAAA